MQICKDGPLGKIVTNVQKENRHSECIKVVRRTIPLYCIVWEKIAKKKCYVQYKKNNIQKSLMELQNR